MNNNKPDDRRDNVEKIQHNINHTITNFRATENLISKVDNEKERQELEDKNQRRLQSLKNMRKEIKDEALDKKNNYK